MTDDECEVGLPQKGLSLLIKEAVPDVRIANETRDLFNQCCAEFVRHLSREAQRISQLDQRKTIYHEHVLKALENLGFPADYMEAADSVLDECKEAAQKKLKRKHSRLEKCGIPEEQLYQIQQQLIEKARAEQAETEASHVAQFKHMLQRQQQFIAETSAAESGPSYLTNESAAPTRDGLLTLGPADNNNRVDDDLDEDYDLE